MVHREIATTVAATVGALAGLRRLGRRDRPAARRSPRDLQHPLVCRRRRPRIALSPESRAGLDPGLREVVAAGEALSAVDYIDAASERAAFGRAMDEMLERFDVLVSPATAIPAFEAGHEVPPGSGLGRWTEWAGFSFPINLSQQPAAVVPCGRTSDGLPIGLQIIGARGRDAEVMAYAQAFETAFPTHRL